MARSVAIASLVAIVIGGIIMIVVGITTGTVWVWFVGLVAVIWMPISVAQSVGLLRPVLKKDVPPRSDS
jgi:hypothetical protein